MDFLYKLSHDPASFFDGKPLWYKVLLVLPWLLLVGLGIFLWVFIAAKPKEDYVKKAENIPYKNLDAAMNRNITELERTRKELRDKIAHKEAEIRKDAANFAKVREDIARESHEELVNRLEGRAK